MVQDQLVDYVSSQMKLGVSRDAIKTALVSAGWGAADVEDTLKKVDGGKSSPAAAMPDQSAGAAKPGATGSGSASMGTDMGAGKGGGGMMRVSDLISVSDAPVTSSASATRSATSSSPSAAKSSPKMDAAAVNDKPMIAGGAMSSPAESKKGKMLAVTIAAILILGLGSLAYYLYTQNSALSSKISDLTASNTGVATQLTAAQTALAASSTSDAAQIASLTQMNGDLTLDLSFFAAPTNVSGTIAQAPIPVTLSGTLSLGAKSMYWVTTEYSAKVLVQNSTDLKVAALLKPLVGTAVQLAGQYVPGSDEMMVASVNGISLNALAATSTAATASSTTSGTASSTTSTTASSTATSTAQ